MKPEARPPRRLTLADLTVPNDRVRVVSQAMIAEHLAVIYAVDEVGVPLRAVVVFEDGRPVKLRAVSVLYRETVHELARATAAIAAAVAPEAAA